MAPQPPSQPNLGYFGLVAVANQSPGPIFIIERVASWDWTQSVPLFNTPATLDKSCVDVPPKTRLQ